MVMSGAANVHRRSVQQALFVTLLWSSSWVLIKWGLADIPPLTFAALRYALAALVLLGWLLPRIRSARLTISRSMGLRLILLGVFYYALAQGGLFLALDNLPAVTVNLVLSFTSILVGILAVPLLGERFTRGQQGAVLLAIAGAAAYFSAVAYAGQPWSWAGFAASVVALLSNVAATLLSRSVNREGQLAPEVVTAISMSLGAVIMLGVALPLNGLPVLSLKNWLYIVWLAVVNAAFAFTLWNRTLQTLSALESSMINSSMMIQIPILALVFLGERITALQAGGLLMSVAGIYLVQRWRAEEQPAPARPPL